MIINQIGSFFTKITGGWIFGDPAEDATLEVTNGDVAIDGTGATGLTYTMPSSSQTLVGRSSTDTLTNKTIDGDTNTIQDIGTSSIKDDAITPAKLVAGTGTGWGWSSWTPTWGNFTPGSATITARYKQTGKTVSFRLDVTLSGSTMGTSPTFTLPVTAVALNGTATTQPLGLLRIFDASPTGTYLGGIYLSSTTVGTLQSWNAAGTILTTAGVTSTAPITWADNDEIHVSGQYEAA